MKTVEYTRIEKPGTKTLCTMQFNKDATVTLDFGKKDGGKFKLPKAFLADAVEHYLTYAIKKGLKDATKKGLLKSNNRS